MTDFFQTELADTGNQLMEASEKLKFCLSQESSEAQVSQVSLSDAFIFHCHIINSRFVF